jgi:hypothetical protein
MAIGKNKKQINVIISIEDLKRLEALAYKQERSISQMAAILIRKALDNLNVDELEDI